MVAFLTLAFFSLAAIASGTCPTDYQSQMIACLSQMFEIMTANPRYRHVHCSAVETGITCARDLSEKCRETRPFEVSEVDAGVAFAQNLKRDFCSSVKCPPSAKKKLQTCVQGMTEIMGIISNTESSPSSKECSQLGKDLNCIEELYEACTDTPVVGPFKTMISVKRKRVMARRSCPDL